MNPKQFDLVVIGDGIAANALIYKIAQLQKGANSIFQIGQLACSALARPVSLESTAMVSPNGIKMGVGPLGDLLYPAFKLTKAHFDSDLPEGVESARQFHIADKGTLEFERLKNRFGTLETLSNLPNSIHLSECHSGKSENIYLIRPEKYLAWLREMAFQQDSINIERMNDLAVEINQSKVKTRSGKEWSASKIFVATGAYNSLFETAPFNPGQKVRSGEYLEVVDYEGGLLSYCLSYKGYNWIYRSSDKTLLIGSTNNTNEQFIGNQDQLFEAHNRFVDNFKLRPVEEFHWKIKSGLRSKLPQRLPQWGEVDGSSVFKIEGLYKNGYTLAHLAANQLAGSILGRHQGSSF